MSGAVADAGRVEAALRFERYLQSLLESGSLLKEKNILIEKSSGWFSWIRRPPIRLREPPNPAMAELAIKESSALKLNVAHDPNNPIYKVSSLYEGTEKIIDDLNINVFLSTQEQLEKIINQKVIESIQTLANKPDSGITFDLLTGRLKLGLRYGIFTAEEVNLYKVTTLIAGGILACRYLNNFNECVTAALATVREGVEKELKLEPAPDFN
jgi:hypothetical protein